MPGANLIQDLKYGLRVLRKNPGFALVAVLVLALGIGANTAIFSVVDTVLLRPLPYRQPNRLMYVWHVPPAKSFPGRTIFAVSPANYLDWKSQNHVFERMAIVGFSSLNMTGRGEPQAVKAAKVSSDFFSVLGVKPMLGRVFLPGEDQPGHGNVVVLSYAFWTDQLGGDPKIIGQPVMFDGQSYTVAGVMPPRFSFPDFNKIWVPTAWTDKERAVRGNHNYIVIARLKPGVSVKQARAEMDTISSRLQRQYPTDDAGWGATVVPMHEQDVKDVRLALLVLLGAVGFVLLIACANVANLMLAKTLSRQKEIAIRTALGASRRRVLQQVLAEALILAVAGGALGLAIAHFGIGLIVALFTDKLPRIAEIGLDGWVLAFTLGVSLLTGIIAGLAPAWRLTKINVNDGLKQGAGRTDADSTGNRTRNVLVVSEVALSLVLLAGAGLMIRSLWMLRSVNPGFDPHNVLTMSVAIPHTKYPKPIQQSQFFEQVLSRVRALPGIESAATIDGLPLQGGSMQPIAIEGRPAVTFAEQPEVAVREISPGYLHVMRVPLLKGRDFTDADQADTPAVVLISKSMAEQFWPNENPIGKHLTLSFFPEHVREVAGVVGDVKQDGLNTIAPNATLYVPAAQIPSPGMSLAIRANGQTAGLASALASAIHEVDADQPITDVKTMNAIVADSLSQQRFSMLLLASFAGLALLLAAVGIYSVLSYAVRSRVREIGIRMALGAQFGDVLRMVIVDGMKPALVGLGVGLAAALGLARVLGSLIFGINAADAATFATVSALLAAVALLASAIPAHRAAKVDPMKALRDE